MDKTKEERQAEVKGALKMALLEIEDEEWKAYRARAKEYEVAFKKWEKECKKSRELLAHHHIPRPYCPSKPASIFSRIRDGEDTPGVYPPLYANPQMVPLVGLRQPIYDTEILVCQDTPNLLRFFQRQLGQYAVDEKTTKTCAETNVSQPGQLSNPLEFDLVGFSILYHGEENDIKRIKATGGFSFTHTGNRVFEQVPLGMIPSSGQIPQRIWPEDRAEMLKAAEDRDVALDKELIRWEKRDFAGFEFFVADRIFRIRPMESFQARVEWPNGAVCLSNDVRIQVIMEGLCYIPA